MNTITNVTIHIRADANIRGSTVKTTADEQYAATFIGESMLFFWDKSQLEALRDLCNKQLEEWK